MRKSEFFRSLKNPYLQVYYDVFSNVRILTRLFSVASVVLLVYLAAGCSYFKVATSAYPETGDLNSLVKVNRTFVIHSNAGVFVVKNISVINDSLIATYVSDYAFPYGKSAFPDVNSTNRYRKLRGDAKVPDEVHIYVQFVTSDIYLGSTMKAISLKDIYKLDIYNKYKSRTTLQWAAGIIGGILAVSTSFMIMFLSAWG